MPTPPEDPRHKNQLFDAPSASEYLKAYAKALHETIQSVDPTRMDSLFNLVSQTLLTGGRVLVGGNGGSASISVHLSCDWMKGTHVDDKQNLKVHSLVSNTPLLTAIANDFGYDQIFCRQIEMVATKGDLVVMISSSGNSPNVIKGTEQAHEMGLKVVGMTGFNGGKLSQLCDLNIHVDSHNYGLVEDAHQAIMHTLAQYLAHWQDTRVEKK